MKTNLYFSHSTFTVLFHRNTYVIIPLGIREIMIEGKEISNTYKIPYGKHVLVHEGDQIFAGDRLCEGAVSPKDILRIRGSAKVQEYLVEAIQKEHAENIFIIWNFVK